MSILHHDERYANRLWFYVVAQHDMVVHQLDVKSAYLHAPIDCELYVEPPQGFREGNDDKAVWKLKKSIYGLKKVVATGT